MENDKQQYRTMCSVRDYIVKNLKNNNKLKSEWIHLTRQKSINSPVGAPPLGTGLGARIREVS